MKKYVINYTGSDFSSNVLYSGDDWSVRASIVREYRPLFRAAISEAQVKKLQGFKLKVLYHSNLDPDNVVGMCKVFVDVLRSMEIVHDDTRMFYRGISIEPMESLSIGTYIFEITEALPLEKLERKKKRHRKKLWSFDINELWQ